MGHEILSDDPDELIRIAVRLWARIKEQKERLKNLELELHRVEDKIAEKMPRERRAVRA